MRVETYIHDTIVRLKVETKPIIIRDTIKIEKEKVKKKQEKAKEKEEKAKENPKKTKTFLAFLMSFILLFFLLYIKKK